MTQQKRPHHHGNLREALILAGLEIVRSEGPDALTLRKCALRAGVSHAAPAHHFNGVTSLRTAIIARGHRIFAQSMRDAIADAASQNASSPKEQVTAICVGYINFAQTHSALFKFMFQPHDQDFTKIDAVTLDEIRRDAGSSYEVLRAACHPLGTTEKERAQVEITIWSMVHGYAMLFGAANSNLGPPRPGRPEPIPTITDLLANLNWPSLGKTVDSKENSQE